MDITFEDIAVDFDKLTAATALSELYPRRGSLHVEIGSGKGTFLLNQARAHPDINYLGIEWANKFYRYSVDRMRRWQVDNVRILRADAREVIGGYLSDASVAAFHIYFPDPWPKKRHHKRRFFTPANIQQIIRCLTNDGELRIATDHADYFQIICELLLHDHPLARCFEQIDFCGIRRSYMKIRRSAGKGRSVNVSEVPPNGGRHSPLLPENLTHRREGRSVNISIKGANAPADPGEWVGSNFERKYLKEGRKIYTLALRKLASSV